jgi:hypothetical protein
MEEWRCRSPGRLELRRISYWYCRYYIQRNGPNETVQAFPDGLRVLTGDPYARSYTGTPESQAISWNWSASFFLRAACLLLADKKIN